VSTTPSPLENLMAQPDPSTPAPSGPSPLENLMQGADQLQPNAVTGEQTNTEGNTVITPKPGESFSDTMTRAAQKGVQTNLADAEKGITVGKVAGTLGAAPVIGAVGAAGLAAPGAMLPTLTEAVKNVGEWASSNPFKAYLLLQAVKEFVPGVKKAIGVIHAAPGPE